ncbi:MAG: hypothetical protein ACREGA_03455 [Candidatus Saccharimonadales bacterium]
MFWSPELAIIQSGHKKALMALGRVAGSAEPSNGTIKIFPGDTVPFDQDDPKNLPITAEPLVDPADHQPPFDQGETTIPPANIAPETSLIQKPWLDSQGQPNGDPSFIGWLVE